MGRDKNKIGREGGRGVGKIAILSTSTSTRIPNHKTAIDKRHMQTTLNKLLDRGS